MFEIVTKAEPGQLSTEIRERVISGTTRQLVEGLKQLPLVLAEMSGELRDELRVSLDVAREVVAGTVTDGQDTRDPEATNPGPALSPKGSPDSQGQRARPGTWRVYVDGGEFIGSLVRLWNVTQKHDAGTSGARAAALVLLGLYNGPRFPFDLTDLRVLDSNNVRDALAVITGDATRCQREVHSWLNVITGRTDFGARFEHLAWKFRVKGRCRRDALRSVFPPGPLIIKESAS